MTRPSRRSEPLARPRLRLLALRALALGLLLGGFVASVASVVSLTSVPSVAAAGPPFPAPTPGRRVYDEAGVLDPGVVASAQSTIASIEERTAAQVVVYTQPVDYGVTTEEALSQARALMDQWGVGRKGFDDGLVILFDIDPSRCHGQVQLYAGAGFRAAFMSDADRQAVYDGRMLPLLRACRLGDALLAGLAAVDANATPDHAGTLERGRQIDAVVGLVLAPLAFFLLVGWTAWHWLRHGRDPVYLDDPSIHIPAPPPDLTPATGTLVLDGRSSRRAFTTALLDLASRGSLAFEQLEEGKVPKVAIDLVADAPTDTASAWERTKAARQPLGPAEASLLAGLRSVSGTRIEPDDAAKLAGLTMPFEKALETHAVAKGWFGDRPQAVMGRWFGLAALEGILAIALGVSGANIPFAGLVMLAVAVGAAAIVTAIFAWSMPARTLPGAMIRAMLAAYRRTLEKTMASARSMGEVVESAGLGWIEGPDVAVVWAVALGLASDVDAVLRRSLEDVKDGRVTPSAVYLPLWYHAAPGSGGSGGWFGGGGGSTFSSSAVPNIGGMMAALGTIGMAPSSGHGGSFGGGGGGGGGGAGGGF